MPKHDKKSIQKRTPFPDDYDPNNNVQVEIPIALIPVLGAYIDRWASRAAWEVEDFEQARQASILLQERLIPKATGVQEHHQPGKHEWKTGTMLVIQGSVTLLSETSQQVAFHFPFSANDYHIQYFFPQNVTFSYSQVVTSKTANGITFYNPAFSTIDTHYLLVGYSA